jgi:hypothetical protein
MCLAFNRQRFVAGIFLLGSGGQVKGGTKDSSVYSACKFPGPKSIHPFAFRTHAHSRGMWEGRGGERRGGEEGERRE